MLNIIALLATLTFVGPDNQIVEEVNQLQGVWLVESKQVSAPEDFASVLIGLILLPEEGNDTHHFKMFALTRETPYREDCTYVISPDTKTIAIIRESRQNQPEIRGTYKLRGDQLTISYAMSNIKCEMTLLRKARVAPIKGRP